MSYYFNKVMKNKSFDEAIEAVTAALKAEGFGVLTEIDVKETLKKKIDVDRTPYKILGACNPVIANDVLNIEPDVGLLLPCNVVLREVETGKVSVSLIDPEAMFTVVSNEEVKDKVDDVKQRFNRIIKLIEA